MLWGTLLAKMAELKQERATRWAEDSHSVDERYDEDDETTQTD